MQFRQFTITGLFGSLNHTIQFPVPSEAVTAPSLVILHGRNGVGKTTILRMIDGLLRLDFNIFRQVPFGHCRLEFDSNDQITVDPQKQNRLQYLEVSFRNLAVRLHPERAGALDDEGGQAVERFRRVFFEATEDIKFEFIDTERLHQIRPPAEELDEGPSIVRTAAGEMMIFRSSSRNPKARLPERPQSLAERVRRFIRDAQINYRTFFSTSEPDLFPRIIERLTAPEQPSYEILGLREQLERIHRQDEETVRLGLEPDRWDYGQLMHQLDALSNRHGPDRQHALTVLGSYVELLGSRAAERALVADRLFTFERLVGEFFGDKAVVIDSRQGIKIHTQSGEVLEERQLSSGEYHLLFLMVAALVTRRRGTVVAIDEPEMSMHIAWQRKLIRALVECASNAEPLFIFATHSPDIAASYPEAMVELG